MSVFDGDGNTFNVYFPTLGGKVFWIDILHRGIYRLQQHKITKHCRILNDYNIRIAWGQEGPMRAEMRKLWETPACLHAKYGDIIGVHRSGGLYDHYGVYEDDNCIYEYGHDKNGVLNIHITTLSEFTKGTGSYFVLVFPEYYGIPGKIDIGPAQFNIKKLNSEGMVETFVKSSHSHNTPAQYVLRSSHETIRRAKSRLGERQYNLFSSNCEHFAIWCKTGLHDSHQIDALFRLPGLDTGKLQ